MTGLTLAVLGLVILQATSACAWTQHSIVTKGPILGQAGSTTHADADTHAAQSIVDEWWGTESERRYRLLSREYRQRLGTALRIRNAKEYDKAVDVPERIWGKRTVERVRRLTPETMQLSLLVEWRQEGYEGVMTFVFDLVRENGAWRIANIMH
jgi:hypothetical protein